MKLLHDSHRRASTTNGWPPSKAEAPPSQPSNLSEYPNQRRWDRIKLGLRCVSTVFIIIVVGESIGVATYVEFDHAWPTTADALVCALILLWDIMESVIIWARQDISNGIPRALHVRAESIFALTILATIAWTATGVGWVYIDFEGFEGGVAISELVFRVFLILTRLALLVRACVEVLRQRMIRKTRRRQTVTLKEDRSRDDLPLTTFHGGTNTNHSTDTTRSVGMTRDFEQKYNFSGLTAAELLEPPTNQKVLLQPTTKKPLRRLSV